MAVDVFGNDIEITADKRRCFTFGPNLHLAMKPVHPVQLVEEFVAADGIAIGKVDVDDANAIDHDFEKSRVAIRFIAYQRGGNDVYGLAGEDGDAVVAFLCDGGAGVSNILEE